MIFNNRNIIPDRLCDYCNAYISIEDLSLKNKKRLSHLRRFTYSLSRKSSHVSTVPKASVIRGSANMKDLADATYRCRSKRIV